MQYLRLHPILEDILPDQEIKFERLIFNGGENHIKLKTSIQKDHYVTIETQLKNSGYIMELLLATDALRRAGAKTIFLLAPYIPGGRQDRVMVPGEPLSIKVFADLINAQGYEKVHTLDPHSSVTTALINNCHMINNHRMVDHFIFSKGDDESEDLIFVSPDAGAVKKTYDIAKMHGAKVITATKRRDVATGKITATEVHASSDDIFGKTCIVVDDICDGGRTFIELGKKLQSRQPEKLLLYVSHGIFSNGLDDGLSRYFDSIATTDCFRLEDDTNRWEDFEIIPLRKEDLK